jgi:hypothetical protein
MADCLHTDEETERHAGFARAVTEGRGNLSAIKNQYVDDEPTLLAAMEAMRDCAYRHLEHDSQKIDAIFQIVFPEFNELLDREVINRDAEAEIQRLANLPGVQYDRERKPAAERLGMRAATLDAAVKAARPHKNKGQGREPSIADVNPSEEPVDLAEILLDAATQYSKYLILPPHGAVIMAAWSMLTHCFQCFAIVPRLLVSAADKECAKSLVLRILKCTSARTVILTNANIAPLFRMISSRRPSIFLDEADNYIHENPQLLALLNDGYEAGGRVWRCEGEDNKVREFEVFAPVAIAMIDRPPSTLLSRSIELRMKRKKPGEKTENFRGDRPNAQLLNIQRKFARAAIDNANALRAADPNMGALFNRDADIWRAMFAIADVAGSDWPSVIREAAQAAVVAGTEQSTLERLLSDIHWIFDGCPDGVIKGEPLDRVTSAELVSSLTGIEGSPWAEWRGGKPLTPNALARLLGKVGIIPGTIRVGDNTAKGYYRRTFDDAFARHLPPEAVTTSQLNNGAHCDGLRSVTTEDAVTFQKASQPSGAAHCDGVTVSSPPEDEWGTIDL